MLLKHIHVLGGTVRYLTFRYPNNVEITFSWPEVADSKTVNLISPRASISTRYCLELPCTQYRYILVRSCSIQDDST